MKNIEVELKFQVLDDAQTEKFLSGFQFIDKKRIVDVYLDTKDRDLYKKGIFIRVRDDKKLDFKVNLADFQAQNKLSRHEHCNEFSFLLPLSNVSVAPINRISRILNMKEISNPDLGEFKDKNNLIDSVTIDKFRQRCSDGKFEYSFDEVKGLGKFIEAEQMASVGDNLERIKDEMRKKLQNLRLKLITTGYNEVYWRKHNFNLYLQGRYLLEEDYGKYRPES